MANGFLAKRAPFKRRIQAYTRRFDAPAAVVYEQLCPTREADWMDGWVADLIYTESGYSEPDCVLSTPDTNLLGAGLWMITETRCPTFHSFVVFRDDGVVGHCTIELRANPNESCDTRWRLVFTATTEDANAIVEAMPDVDPTFEIVVLESLAHFLQTGRRMELAR
jgi:hypothetical protein